MKKPFSLPVKPAWETRPLKSSAANPQARRFNTNQEHVADRQKKIRPTDLDSQHALNIPRGSSGERDLREGKYTPTEKPW